MQASAGQYLKQSCGADTTCHKVSDEPTTTSSELAFILDDGPDAGRHSRGDPKDHHLIGWLPPKPQPIPIRESHQRANRVRLRRNMPYIDPQNPGNSFILYKMIIGTLHCPAGKTDDAVDPASCNPDGTYQKRSQVLRRHLRRRWRDMQRHLVHHKDDRVLGYPAGFPRTSGSLPPQVNMPACATGFVAIQCPRQPRGSAARHPPRQRVDRSGCPSC